MILGFDPGRDKCGIAVVNPPSQVVFHQVIASSEAITIINSLAEKFPLEKIVLGNLTTSKSWFKKLSTSVKNITIVMVDESNSTQEARTRYWQMYPPRGFTKLIPLSMRIPPRPIDDIVAILLVERYFRHS